MAVTPTNKIVRGGDLKTVGTEIKSAIAGKQDVIQSVQVTVDNNTGTPSASGSVSGSTLSLSFQNLKGGTGATGPQGPAGSDAPQPFKGYYATATALASAHPSPNVGDYAYVKSGSGATIYMESNGAWADTGIAMAITDVESVFTTQAKEVLLALLGQVAYVGDNAQTYIDEFRRLLLSSATVESLSVIVDSSVVIFDSFSLDAVRAALTVTASYSDGTQATVSGYEVAGLLTAGVSNLTVTYSGVSATVAVNVLHNYAGALSSWRLATTTNSTNKYENGVITMLCRTSSDYSNYAIWGADCKGGTMWSDVNGKRLKFRIKCNNSSLGAFGQAVYKDSSITSMGSATNKRKTFGSLTLADDGYYETVEMVDISTYTNGSLTPGASATFGVFAYCRTQTTALTIEDVQVYEVSE